MLRRFVGTKSGKKQSKSGVILVTILFILAVAFILIGAALIMTAKTRSRLYTFAEGSQARLTATAAAQLFDNALYTQEIRDKEFVQLCNADAKVYFKDPSIPGMGGDETTSPDNYTIAVFDKVGTKYTVAFTTRIGDEVENVLLTYEGVVHPTSTSPFAFQVELGEGGRLERVAIGSQYGTAARYNADDNVVVVRGSGSAPMDSCDYYSTFVTTAKFRSASGTHFYGDLVYAGANAGVDTTPLPGVGTGSGAMLYGCDVFFLNCTSAVQGGGSTNELFTASSGSPRIVFSNVSGGLFGDQGFSGFTGAPIYLLAYHQDSDSFTFGSSGVGLGIQTPLSQNNSQTPPGPSAVTGKDIRYYIGNLDQYTDPNYSPDPGNVDPRPSSYQEFCDAYSSLGLNSNGHAPAGADALSTTDTNSGSVYKVNGGTITSAYTISVASNNVVVYITDDITLKDGGSFIVTGGDGTDTSNKCYFILAPGKTITLDGDNACGFYSANVHAGGGLEDAITQTQAPVIYIIGSGATNTDTALGGRRQIAVLGNGDHIKHIEAMVALYPLTDTQNDAGDFYSYSGPSAQFYGRIIARTVVNATGSHMSIPYCPQFSSGENPNMLYEVTSDFTCVSFDYYYDDTDTNHGGSGLHE